MTRMGGSTNQILELCMNVFIQSKDYVLDDVSSKR